LFDQDNQGGVVVTIAGVVEEHEESLVGRKSAGNVLFKVTESPPGKVFLDLMTRMMGQRSEVNGVEAQRLYGNTMGAEISIMPALDVCLRFQGGVLTVDVDDLTERAIRESVCGKVW